MPGQSRLTTPAGTEITGYWQHDPLEIPSATRIAAWLDQADGRDGPGSAVFAGLKITVISDLRTDRLQLAREGRLWTHGADGLAWPDNALIEMRGSAANPRCLAHELGHQWMYRLQVWDGSDRAGQAVWDLLQALRGMDTTPNTSLAERAAEDVAALMGPDGVAGTVNSGDDGRRKPWDVPGLHTFLLTFPAIVEYWRRLGGISHPNYNPAESGGTWSWYRSWGWWIWAGGQWERYTAGRFQRHDGATWVVF